MSRLCPSCRAESDAWLEFRPRVLGLTIHEKATRDTTKQGVRDRNAAKAAEWRELVRFQRSLIARTCAHITLAAVALLSVTTYAAADEPTPSPTVSAYPLEEWVPTDVPTTVAEPSPSTPTPTPTATPAARPGLPRTGA